jgi:peptidoglycan/xylan/chitin deacetylase (PgdA/CDA1 family)
MIRFYKFPKWLKGFYPGAIWDFFLVPSSSNKLIYLTFDDGPTIEVTDWILSQLDKVNAKATFFCVGENVKNLPNIYKTYLKKGHAVGNHTMNHLKGFNTDNDTYIDNILKAAAHINSLLFRPPYGKCSPNQFKLIKGLGFKTVFWSHLTYDFDSSLTSNKRIKVFKKNLKSGSIIVFHDSLKAYPQLKTDLPIILNYLKQENFNFEIIKT